MRQLSLPIGFMLVAAGILNLVLKFTTTYSMFEPVWPPLITIAAGVLIIVYILVRDS